MEIGRTRPPKPMLMSISGFAKYTDTKHVPIPTMAPPSATASSFAPKLRDLVLIGETPSDLPGHSFRVSSSIDDGVIALDDDGGVDVLVADDSIRFFTSDPPDGENFVADFSVLKKFKFLLGGDRFEETLDDDEGIAVIPSEPLSTLIVIDLDSTNGINETPSEPFGRSFRVSTSVDNGVIMGLDDDNEGVAMIPNEPPGPGSRMSTSIVTQASLLD